MQLFATFMQPAQAVRLVSAGPAIAASCGPQAAQRGKIFRA